MDDDEIERGIENLNPVLRHAVEQITVATARSFGQVWLRPDAAATVEGFLSGEIVFVVTLNELQVLAADQVKPRDPPPPLPEPGGYL
jgi:hypothetical protein